MIVRVRRLFEHEASAGILLALAAVAALAMKNSPLAGGYGSFLALPVEVRVGVLEIAKPLLLWVNDGLMAVFFFLVGLEIKRELLEGNLSTPRQALLPVLAAIGGMAVPAAIYAWANWGDPVALRGWAIPSATDIAFALGALALLGQRAPLSLKVFLTAVAVIDDLGAIVIIALFYTAELSPAMIGLAAAGMAVLAALNRGGVGKLGAYVLVGLVIWVCVLKSGVHATLAGVVTALFVPVKASGGRSPLHAAEHELQPWVAFGILPLFAFANAGVPLDGVSFSTFSQGVPLGIAAGLVFGKAIGVFGVSWLAVRSGLAPMPHGASWSQLFGVALLCGIGFTMSLFIGSLAFEGIEGGADWMTQVRLGVLGGSLVAGLAGYAVLRWLARQAAQPA